MCSQREGCFMSINDNNLSVDVFDAVRARLISASLVSGGKSVDVRVSHAESSGRPQIVMEPLDIGESSWTFNNVEGSKSIPVVMRVFAGNHLDNAVLGDLVTGVVKLNDIQGINLVLLSSSNDFTNVTDNKYKSKTISATYNRE